MKVKVLYNTNQTESYRLEDFPDACPVCHRCAVIEPENKHPNLVPPGVPAHKKKLQLLCRCPSGECGTLFIAEYERHVDEHKRHLFQVKRLYPFAPVKFDAFEGISEVSPNFVEIAHEASQADQYQLLGVACIGFRRALKCLVKDHCVRRNPEHKGLIKKLPLGKCIRDYVKDTRLRQSTEQFAWLGNDEAQYERAWTKEDLVTLKDILVLAQIWVASDLLADRIARGKPHLSIVK